MQNTDTTPALLVTRFDVRESEDGNEVRLFAGRKIVHRFGEDDCAEGKLDELPAFLADLAAREVAATVEVVEAFLTGEDEDEGEDEAPGSVVPEEYRKRYGAEQNCGDDVAVELSAFVACREVGEDGKEREGMDRSKLRGVAEANGCGDKLAAWEDRGSNGGLLRMSVSNILRGMVRRGERVEIGEKVWEADPSIAEAKKAERAEARKAAAARRKAAKAS